MVCDAPEKLAREIYSTIPDTGRFEQDIYNDYLLTYSRHTIAAALQLLRSRKHVRQCGSAVRPLYIRSNRSVRYDNIRPASGEQVLLQMHANFATEKPR